MINRSEIASQVKEIYKKLIDLKMLVEKSADGADSDDMSFVGDLSMALTSVDLMKKKCPS